MSAAPLLRLKDLSARLGVPKSTAHLWISSGRLAHYKIGSVILVAEADLEAFLALHKCPAKSARPRRRGAR